MTKPSVFVLILCLCIKLIFAQDLGFKRQLHFNDAFFAQREIATSSSISKENLQDDLRFILFKSFRITNNSETDFELDKLIDFHKTYSDLKIDKNIDKINELKGSMIYKTFYSKDGHINITSLSDVQIDTSLSRIDILKDSYFQPNYNARKKLQFRFSNKGKIVTKDGLRFQIGKKARDNKPFDFITFEDRNYEIQVVKSITKKVFGYDCFLIRLFSKTDSNVWFDLYVTEQLEIAYNPLFNLQRCHKYGYFILEKIKFTSNSIEITQPKYIQL